MHCKLVRLLFLWGLAVLRPWWSVLWESCVVAGTESGGQLCPQLSTRPEPRADLARRELLLPPRFCCRARTWS